MRYQNQGWTTPYADALPAPAIEMGRDFSPSTAPAQTMTAEQVYRAFVAMAKEDPAYLVRLAAAFDHKAPFRKAAPILPLSIKAIRTVEVNLWDKPPKITKRERPDRAALRFACNVQVTTAKSSQVSKPCWTGYAQFRTPERMAKDALDLHRKKSMSAAHRDWLVNDVVPMAQANGWLIGCLRIGTDQQGKPYADRQVIVIEQDGAERHALAGAHILSKAGDVTAMAELPAFASTTSTGRALGGGMVLQSRGSRASDKLDWRTGEVRVAL